MIQPRTWGLLIAGVLVGVPLGLVITGSGTSGGELEQASAARAQTQDNDTYPAEVPPDRSGLPPGIDVESDLAKTWSAELGSPADTYPAEVPPDRSGLPPGVAVEPDIEELWAPSAQASGGDDPNVISHVPPPAALVEECRADPSAEDICGVALAMADGKLPPGVYTDEELHEAVAAAGYTWP